MEKTSAPDPALAPPCRVQRKPPREDYGDLTTWLGGPFDPKVFDREKVDGYLRKLKWPRVTENQLARELMQRDNE